eukprot:TRINITY_DN1423_c0_g1_i1.p3 TRINITY_DN1423_c0_g1~~TRINITY_DN1423_c0_g1_i1.p3  ORF type:complete len:134 (-),score=4.04 TRINITY_DN1423_c0_g1_i1:285-686(-)
MCSIPSHDGPEEQNSCARQKKGAAVQPSSPDAQLPQPKFPFLTTSSLRISLRPLEISLEENSLKPQDISEELVVKKGNFGQGSCASGDEGWTAAPFFCLAQEFCSSGPSCEGMLHIDSSPAFCRRTYGNIGSN